MKVRLILPKNLPSIASQFVKVTLDRAVKMVQPPLSLPYLAALIPRDIEVKIVDENFEEINYKEDVDMAGISIPFTHLAPHAYEIADQFRKGNIKVVLGGVHPTFMPEEAIEHADSVVIGEAETTWERLWDDFRNGSLQKFYKSSEHSDLDKLPLPRKDLLNLNNYIMDSIQTSRGCPHNCSFCVTRQMFGNKTRYRSLETLISEIKNSPFRNIEFVDEDIAANKERAKELFEALIPLKIKWQADAPVYIIGDDELLELARKSGCYNLAFGFESINEDNVKDIGKPFFQDPNYYPEMIEKVHYYGISVNGSFLFGLEHDDKQIFDEFLDFVEKTKMEVFAPFIVTPFPGTPLYKNLEKEGRIIDKDWSKYDSTHVVFQPKLLTVTELYKGVTKIWLKSQQLWNRYYGEILE